ncbi:HEAT repeat protein [Streptomyces sp. 846.5]|nr:HEAT repeat domain-containing protein [Streptomyces sp. 846.5]TDT94126.1 HEAT repeat protein [Streptomyces sp. 846.5]
MSGFLDGFLRLLSAFVLVLLVLLAALRATRWVRHRRREHALEPLRGLLLELLCAEGEGEAGALSVLARLDDRAWTALEPTARAMLAKVSGQARDSLVELFEQRGVAVRALADLGRRGTVRRARAAEVLGLLRYRPSVRALCRLLCHRDPEVRVVAGRALGRIGDASAVPDLLDCLHGLRPVPQSVVLRALTGFGPEGQTPIGAGLSDPDPLVRAMAIEALGATGAVAWAHPIAVALLQDPDPEVQIRAARALGTLGMPSGVAPLLSAVEPGRPVALRTVAARALGRLGDVSAASRLQSLLGDPSHHLATTAAGALLQLGPDGRAALGEAAAGALGDRAAAQARAALAQAALREGSGPVPNWSVAVGP